MAAGLIVACGRTYPPPPPPPPQVMRPAPRLEPAPQASPEPPPPPVELFGEAERLREKKRKRSTFLASCREAGGDAWVEEMRQRAWDGETECPAAPEGWREKREAEAAARRQERAEEDEKRAAEEARAAAEEGEKLRLRRSLAAELDEEAVEKGINGDAWFLMGDEEDILAFQSFTCSRQLTRKIINALAAGFGSREKLREETGLIRVVCFLHEHDRDPAWEDL